MTTVARRTFRSSPYRDAAETWIAVVDLITLRKSSGARTELLAVSGVASSIIADQAPKDSPIVVTCDGPRTRIYCLYDEDAVDGADANEDLLGFDPLQGDWKVSLPCLAGDLPWVQAALKKHGSRVTARNLDEVVKAEANEGSPADALVLDVEGFLGS